MTSLDNLILTREERGIIDIPVEENLVLMRNERNKITNLFIHACEEGYNPNQIHKSFTSIAITQDEIDLVQPGEYIPLYVNGGGWANWYYFRPNQIQHVLMTITTFVNEFNVSIMNVTVSDVSEQRPRSNFREEDNEHNEHNEHTNFDDFNSFNPVQK
jgi:hypothetical protein